LGAETGRFIIALFEIFVSRTVIFYLDYPEKVNYCDENPCKIPKAIALAPEAESWCAKAM